MDACNWEINNQKNLKDFIRPSSKEKHRQPSKAEIYLGAQKKTTRTTDSDMSIALGASVYSKRIKTLDPWLAESD
jgi:hypothetical protein